MVDNELTAGNLSELRTLLDKAHTPREQAKAVATIRKAMNNARPKASPKPNKPPTPNRPAPLKRADAARANRLRAAVSAAAEEFWSARHGTPLPNWGEIDSAADDELMPVVAAVEGAATALIARYFQMKAFTESAPARKAQAAAMLEMLRAVKAWRDAGGTGPAPGMPNPFSQVTCGYSSSEPRCGTPPKLYCIA